MKSVISIILMLLFQTSVYASEIIEFGIATAIKSEVMKENRPYMVYLPPSYEKSSNTYPVIYLLDGDIHRFKGFVGVLESLSSQTLENQVKEAIVIAIPNTNRSRDLTPSTLKEWTFRGRVLDTFDRTGNALNFATFLKAELIPHIEKTYRASEKRVLVGESFGGLFASNVIVFTPTMFSDYLIIDPTALWDNDYLNRAYLANLKSKNLDINVFFAFANNSHLDEIGLTNYAWGSAFATSIIKHSNGIAKQQYFENETHGTVALLAWYNGLKTLLPSENK
ncbi:alpha/beta hydrolase [Pseudoalteromonas sp. G4]|uniref:alpha/beta hydrolase n=1 Tax=Pseudoalteromonas sp. G4 TaxID=2992761 RepID=UPI00237D78BD|nr:alpha/beta hydrolase-fold protein [Pseudoalteromonas sp. G4]MDE3271859.1 alpha/beta hydrolase-fold protein [Pseudoalteromonas sp. G4]